MLTASAPPISADPPALILASTSPYRRELLQRLRLPFDCIAPQVDETPQPGELAGALAQRLALEKARAVAAQHPDAVVIGADQVAELDGQTIGKPGNHANAVVQLQAMRGRSVLFHTAVAVVQQQTGFAQSALAVVQVQFRPLDDAQIECYLRAETPYDCAGSAKCEGLGISLLAAIHSGDPTALIGLPLIHTCTLLRLAGINILGQAR